MAGNLKYTYYKHKGKILTISSILLALILGLIVYLLISNDVFKSKPELLEEKHTLAEYVVTATNEGMVQLIDVESKEVVDEQQLDSKNVHYTMANDYETLYSYDGKEVKSFRLASGKIKEQETIAAVEVDQVDSFKVHGESVVILSDNQTTLTFVYPEEGGVATKRLEVEEGVDSFHLYEEKLMYAALDKLHVVDANKEEVIEIGDKTYAIHNHGSNWLIQNQFGSELDSNILVMLNHQDGKIIELEKTESGETQLLSFDENQDTIYTTHYVNATEPYHLLTTWYVENNELKMERDIMVRIPVKEDAILYNSDTTVTSKGYMYTHFNDRLNIFDIRSQQEHSQVPVYDFFAQPVLSDS